MGMKMFITGATGFIGKNAHEYFGKKYKIFAPSHGELDLLDANAVRDYVKENLAAHGGNSGCAFVKLIEPAGPATASAFHLARRFG
jgi:nucleoside-diphosphate-sugar epimerase